MLRSRCADRWMNEPSTPDSRRNSVVGGLTPAQGVVSEEERARQAEAARNDPGTTEQEKGSKGLDAATVTGAQSPRCEGGLPTLGRRADELETDRKICRRTEPPFHANPPVRRRERTHGTVADELRLRQASGAGTGVEKPRFFDAPQEADRGALRTFVQMLETKAVEGLRNATRSIENMLEGRHSYFHMNGDLSTRSPENRWTRHHGTNGRESVIDIDTAGRNGTAQTDGHRAGDACS